MAAGRSASGVLLALAVAASLLPGAARAADDPRGLSSRIGATCSAALARIDEQAQSNHGALVRRMRTRAAAEARLRTLRARETTTHRSLGTADARVRAALATLGRFTAAHPEKALAPSDYAAYQRLRATYVAALGHANALVRVSNALVRAYNASVVTVNTSSDALARLATADNQANATAQAREDACLAPIGDWADATRALDARLAAAARAAGSRSPSIRARVSRSSASSTTPAASVA